MLLYAAVQSSNIINIFDSSVVDGLIDFSVGTCQLIMLCDTETQQNEWFLTGNVKKSMAINVLIMDHKLRNKLILNNIFHYCCSFVIIIFDNLSVLQA